MKVSIRRVAPLEHQGRDVWPYMAPPPGPMPHDVRREPLRRQREHARRGGR